MSRGGRRRLLALLVGGATAFLVVRLELLSYLTVEGMRAAVEAYGPLGPLVFIAIFVLGFFIPGPELLFAALGAILFGRVRGFAYAYVAAMIGTTTTFLLVRYTAQDWVQRTLRHRFPRLDALDDRLARHGRLTVATLRLVFFLSPPLNWALGTMRVRVSDYVLGTAVGILPGLGLTVYLADALAEADSKTELTSARILVPVAALVVLFVVAGLAGRRIFGRSRAEVDPSA